MNRLRRAGSFALLFLALGAADAIAQKRCVKGQPCGNSCIAQSKTCRIGTGSATRAPTSTVAPVAIPQEMQFVASTRGTTYYFVGCDGWKNLSRSNLRWFETVDEARAAGLKPSAQPGCAGPPPSAAAADTCIVERVVDGDTLECADSRRVRLLLVDAPEMDQGPFGPIAKRELEQIAAVGEALRVEQDVDKRDRYGRTLAHLYLPDGRSVNELLLRSGVAVVSVYPPNVRYVDRYRAVSDSAKAAGVGLWSGSAFECMPADYRAGQCR